MTNLEKWADSLTSEEVHIFARFGFICNMCPANIKCRALNNNLLESKKLCDDYHAFCTWLESEVEE